MAKLFFLTGFLFFVITGFAQTKAPAQFATAKYAGYYGYGKNVEKEGIGSVIIYPESDTTVLFYLDLNSGPPNRFTRSLYARAKIVNDTATFYTSYLSLPSDCVWQFRFSKNEIILKKTEPPYRCELDHDFQVEGIFKRQSKKIIEECLSPSGDAINFKMLKPENYKNN